MNRQLSAAALMLAFVTGAAALAAQRGGPETFTATATTKSAGGAGTGTLAPAARITAQQDTFVVKDYADDIIRLTAVTVRR